MESPTVFLRPKSSLLTIIAPLHDAAPLHDTAHRVRLCSLQAAEGEGMDSAVVDTLGVGSSAGRTMPDECHPGRICGVRGFDQSFGVNIRPAMRIGQVD